MLYGLIDQLEVKAFKFENSVQVKGKSILSCSYFYIKCNMFESEKGDKKNPVTVKLEKREPLFFSSFVCLRGYCRSQRLQ